MMKNALLIYSHNSGQGQLARHREKILARLRKVFDEVDVKETHSAEEGHEVCKAACGKYHTLIVAGGDGTFHNAVEALAEMDNTPVLAYINNGTVGDIGHNFGVKRSYKSALKVIEKGEIEPFDIARVNGCYYFDYVAAIGSYANIPLTTKRQRKKFLGVLAYYTDALGEAFGFKKIHVEIKADGVTYEQDVPLVLLLNGKHVGGFLVNNKANIFDGKMELYLAKPGLFNGLLQFLPGRKVFIKKIVASTFDIHTSLDGDTVWDFDGDAGPVGDLHVECLHHRLKAYSIKHPKK
ncbi:MAG: YegS/Rv2252/BmrU family lipid kinase [Bacilli bacterium]|nr:YegS/Rv2252/BmrU family lipid kinase [Bacilli bacterium]